VRVEFPALAVLDDESRRRVLAAAQRRRYRRGEVVFHQGDPANSLHLLAAGHVCVRVTTALGDIATFTVLSAGSLFGELSLLGDGAERSATIEALEAAETLVITTDELRRLRKASPQVDAFLLGLLAGYIRRQDARLLEALYVPADKRVLRRLLDLAGDYGAGRPGTVVPLTQDVVASMAGTTRPTANQVLRAAEEAGLVTISRGRIRVDDPVGLARRAR
jgi:CRP/FNR family transcriptional regulator, cyclic AMP receptor protein